VIDFHCHLDLYPNYHAVRQECDRRGMYVLSVTTTPSAWKGTLALSEGSPRIRTALGLHPHLAGERMTELPLFDALLAQTRYVGEIGLDGAPEFRKSWNDQVTVFEHILAQCRKAGGRVMSIHSRRASGPVLDWLEKEPDAGTPVLHWFSGNFRDLNRAISLGCWFSIGPAMLAGSKGRELAMRMPRERVLTESDGPFAQFEGVPVLPWQVEIASKALSKIWSVPLNEVQEILIRNLRSLLAEGDIQVPTTDIEKAPRG
jgi:TatD DNase family protein